MIFMILCNIYHSLTSIIFLYLYIYIHMYMYLYSYGFAHFVSSFLVSEGFRSQVKVKEWEETREEQKRRILEGPMEDVIGHMGSSSNGKFHGKFL